ncbi:P-loop containing nucleoside triphosphate hydrolase protein [Xylaria sp. FL1777]|nr:P-loop containing nucleoside triphosphate hydrolase protein [Xylaria sp. FL1777]
MPGSDLAGAASAGNDKRKRGESDPSTKGKPNKRPKTDSKRDIARRKTEIKNKLGNMYDWNSKGESEIREYTPEQYKREEIEYEEALLVLGGKYKIEGREDCGNKLGRIKGMSSTIRDYQTVGVAFMVRQERSQNDCRGGIIADDMGIGKTVQSIGCMLVNPPPKKAIKAGKGATLIIVPNQGLTKQWIQELCRHGEIPKKEVCTYVGGGKMSSVGIAAHSFVFATYSQVERDFRSFGGEVKDNEGDLRPSNSEVEDDEGDLPPSNSKVKDEEAPLFEIEFFRILLDEGDNIKNFRGSTSKACAGLKAKLKWVLSGTPLRNSVKECLPYFRFLGIKVNLKRDIFAKIWGEPESNKVHDRTMQILAKRMLRRETGQMFLGREMCELPKSYYEDRLLSITDEEREFSRHLEQAMCRVEEEAIEKKKLLRGKGKHERKKQKEDKDDPKEPKSNFWVRTARLRQAVDHPFLLENPTQDFMNQDELESLKAELDTIEQSKRKTKGKTLFSDEFLSSHLGDLSINEIVLDMKSHINYLLSSRRNVEIGGCLECFSMVELQSLECGHAMCRRCYKKHIGAIATKNKSQLKCPWCGKVVACITNLKEELDDKWPSAPMKPRNEVLRTPDGRSVSVHLPSEVNKRSPGDDFNGVQPRSNNLNSRWLQRCDNVGKIPLSTKTIVAIQIVEMWQKEAPNDQIIIFTEWIGTAVILGRLFNKCNINFVYYNGQMNMEHRNNNLSDFKNNSEIKVMIMSMGTGNVGLNITNANRMIIMNPWWNNAAEAQAFGRIKRHGQRKETHLIRLFARDTIDERIHKLQIDKKEEIRAAMAQGKTPKPLSREEKHWLLTDRNSLKSPLAESDQTFEDDDLDSNSDSDDDWVPRPTTSF